MSTSITYIEKDQDWQNQATTYWFATEIDGQHSEYGIRESEGHTGVIHESGEEVEDRELAERIKAVCVVDDDMRAE